MRLIDATKAIESIDEIVCSMSVCINSDYYNGMRKMKDMALHAIEKQPIVDAEPVRHGEWVKMRGMMPPEYMGLKECSVCGWHIHPLGRTAFDLKESEFRYCPRCGARLDRESNG